MTDPISSDGLYGIDKTLAVVDTANTFYDGYKAVMEDQKVTPADSFVLFKAGPELLTSITTATGPGASILAEFLDRSEAENARIYERAGSRMTSPAYRKILKGLLTFSDGIVEAIKEDTPTA